MRRLRADFDPLVPHALLGDVARLWWLERHPLRDAPEWFEWESDDPNDGEPGDTDAEPGPGRERLETPVGGGAITPGSA